MTNRKQATGIAFTRQIGRLERRLLDLDRLSRRYSWARLALALTGTIAAFFAFRADQDTAGWLCILGFTLAFGLTAHFHRRVTASITRHRIWRRLKTRQLARLQIDWPALPPPLTEPAKPDHPFGADLNLTGPRSLLHLIDTCISRGGSERLKAWLLEPDPDPENIRARQAQVREIAPLAMYRDRLALHSILVTEDPDEAWDGERLLTWLDQHTVPTALKPWLVFLGALAAVNLTLVVLHVLGLAPLLWPFTLAVYAWVYLFRHRSFKGLFDEAYHLQKTLTPFRAVLLYLETYNYKPYPGLASVCKPLCAPGRQPSQALKQLARIATAASSQKSEVLWLLLNATMPWDLFFAHRLNRYKEALRDELPGWLEAWYRLEALGALANFSYLNPDYAFPGLIAENEGPALETKDIGHPLLPDDVKVRNDYRAEEPGELAIITGSNMSGKSTFLRTMGINLCLAYAGGPVDAALLRVQAFRLFTCIQVSDSVNDGISYFYAEVRRLKALLDALQAPHPRPLFFLIDEIFRGTNNRERLIGSRAFLRTLARGRGVGAVSTHDLELVSLADEITGIHNFHFREEIEEGRMVFDYRLHPGPCPTTNALRIMALEGLPVEVEPSVSRN